MPIDHDRVQAIQKPCELSWFKVHDLFFRSWPFEGLLLQPLLPQAEAVDIPVEDLDDISAAVAEDKEMSGEGIKLKLGLDHNG